MRTLVLNAGYEPLAIVSFRRALVLVLNNKATVLRADDAHPVAASIGLFDRPSVIVLTRYYTLQDAYDNLRLIARELGPEAEARAVSLFRQLSLPNPETIGARYPHQVSGGQLQRVMTAMALCPKPDLVIFDEPTTGLDPIMSGVINELIREIVVEMGATAMTITHDMSSVRAIADRVAMLHDGLIRWSGPVGEMDSTPDPYVQQFIHGRAEGPIAAVR